MKLNNVRYEILSSYLRTLFFYSAYDSSTLYTYKISSSKGLPAMHALFFHALGYSEEKEFTVPEADTTSWDNMPVSMSGMRS